MTKRDPHGNIVRAPSPRSPPRSAGPMRITVLPFSAALGIPDAFLPAASPATRNSSSSRKPIFTASPIRPPARGAIEALTDQLCRVAWDLVPGHRARGGAAKALEAGSIQKEVARVRAERAANVARRKETLVGTSDFPDLAEDKVPILSTPRLSTSTPTKPRSPDIVSAESFERLRDRSDDHLTRHGSRPRYSSLASGAPPTSMRGRASPRACSRLAA